MLFLLQTWRGPSANKGDIIMKKVYWLAVNILIVSISFIATQNLSFAGRDADRSYPVSTHEIAGEQGNKKISLQDGSSKQLSQNEREQIEKEKKSTTPIQQIRKIYGSCVCVAIHSLVWC